MVNGQALVDGNKRLEWLTTAVFLEINRVAISRADNDEVYELVIDVAAVNPTVEEIALRLRQLITQPKTCVRADIREHHYSPSDAEVC